MSKTYHLHLRGFVGGADFDASYVSYVLSKNANKPVDVLIDSLGGSLATALSIASAFKDHGDVHAHFVGMNASAATIASLGAKHITMDASAMYLVHKCSMTFFQWASLNADQLQEQIAQMEQTKTDLEKMDGNVATMYAKKCRKPVQDLLDLMKVGGWLTAQEALDWGFVDELTDSKEDAAPVLTDKTAAAMASVGMPIPNIPVEGQASLWERFLSSLSSFIGSNKPQSNQQPINPIVDMHKFPILAGLLALEAVALTDGKCSLTEEQLGSIEAQLKELTDAKAANEAATNALKETHATALSEKDSKIAELQALLDKKPGADTQHVNPATAQTEAEAFAASVMGARELLDQLPQ